MGKDLSKMNVNEADQMQSLHINSGRKKSRKKEKRTRIQTDNRNVMDRFHQVSIIPLQVYKKSSHLYFYCEYTIQIVSKQLYIKHIDIKH